MTTAQAAKSDKLLAPILLVCSLILIVVLKLGFIFLLIALLPAAVAYFIDSSEDKSAFRIVMLCNLAATLPTLLPMLFASIKMERVDVMDVMMDMKVWLVIYSGAAAGWCLVYLCRFIARFLMIMYLDYRVQALERFQKKLIAEWGERIKEKIQ
jgi:hypothetical protein